MPRRADDAWKRARRKRVPSCRRLLFAYKSSCVASRAMAGSIASSLSACSTFHRFTYYSEKIHIIRKKSYELLRVLLYNFLWWRQKRHHGQFIEDQGITGYCPPAARTPAAGAQSAWRSRRERRDGRYDLPSRTEP